MESFNGKYYTTNNDSYTDEHNKIMTDLLWAYFMNTDKVIMYDEAEYDDETTGFFFPLNQKGADFLEHLLDCDLISVVAD